MAIIQHTTWTDIGQALMEYYYDKYVTPERIDNVNPLEWLVPTSGATTFFGTKPLNLFIVGKPYGWFRNSDGELEDQWPPPDLVESIEWHKAVYEQYSIYKTYIWMDWVIVDLIMQENEESNFEEMMTTTEGHIIEMCEELAEYGFTYLGRLTEDPGIDYFIALIEEFLALRRLNDNPL